MKIAKPFSKEAEHRLIDAVREVTANVEEVGMAPDDAVIKTARDNNLPPGWVSLLVQAYNNGRTAFHRQRGNGVLEKIATFPLADLENVMTQLYPAKPESPAEEHHGKAVSAEYSTPPTWAERHYQRKAAAELGRQPLPGVSDASPAPPPLPREPESTFREQRKQYELAKRAAAEAAADVRGLTRSCVRDLELLARRFRGRPAAEFTKCAYWAEKLFGRFGKHAMEFVRRRHGFPEPGSDPPRPDGLPVRADLDPYSYVKAAFDSMHKLVDAAQRAGELRYREKVACSRLTRGACRPDFSRRRVRLSAKSQPSPILRSREKHAVSLPGQLLHGVTGGLGMGLVRKFDNANPGTELQDEFLEEMNDPLHERQLRAIRSRAVLAELLNTDEVISGYDPTEVTEAYNEIATISPIAAGNAAVLRGLLRRRLAAGVLEPFEAQQLVEIERRMRGTPDAGNA